MSHKISSCAHILLITDFIANFGGILGLFLGVSILSLVEIIYFMAFRNLDEKKKSPVRKEKSVESLPNIANMSNSDIIEASVME